MIWILLAVLGWVLLIESLRQGLYTLPAIGVVTVIALAVLRWRRRKAYDAFVRPLYGKDKERRK
ncbi:MAG TPA: hypothetical protein VIX63_12905 [Vicinamibacterales bacterium]